MYKRFIFEIQLLKNTNLVAVFNFKTWVFFYWSFSVWHKMFLSFERFNRYGINSVIFFFSGLNFILINFHVSLIDLLIYLIVRFYSHHLSVFLKQCQHFIVNNMFMDLVNIGNFATYNSHMRCLKMWGP